MKQPNFFIVGAPKCGTTALSEYLRSHPNIFMSQPKEPHYFSQDFAQHRTIKNFEKYMALFQGTTPEHSIIGEASVWYLYSSVAIQNIYNFNPHAKIVVMLRNPVDMVYSLHSQLLFSGYENEKFFQQAWNIIEARKKGKFIPRCTQPEFFYYSDIGKLGSQVKRLLTVFPREQVHFILFDEFVLYPQIVYENVLQFLEVDNDLRKYFPRINENKMQKIYWLNRFLCNPPQNLLGLRQVSEKFGLKNHILKAIKKIQVINSTKKPRKNLTHEFELHLKIVFQQDIADLERLLEVSLSNWKI